MLGALLFDKQAVGRPAGPPASRARNGRRPALRQNFPWQAKWSGWLSSALGWVLLVPLTSSLVVSDELGITRAACAHALRTP
jgi:hypothetical protein